MARDYDDVHIVSSDSEDDESVNSDADEENGFFDLEASEEGSDVASEEQSDAFDAIYPHSFPKFMQLPLELRELVWKAFCPDLDTAPRVFEVNYGVIRTGQTLLDDFRFGVQVESQVKPMRTLLAIHQESRTLGLKFSPDCIGQPGEDGLVPCSMERDIIYLTWDTPRNTPTRFVPIERLAEIAGGVQNLAISFDADPPAHMESGAFAALRSLKNIFVVGEAEEAATKGLAFSVSEESHEYHIRTEEIEPGLGEDMEMAFCWPDPEMWGDAGQEMFTAGKFDTMIFDDEHHPVDSEGNILSERPTETIFGDWGYVIETTRMYASHESLRDPEDDEEEEDLVEDRDIKVWPMARFVFDGIDRLELMKAWKRPWDEWESEEDSDDDSPDEYESYGIDDRIVDDFIVTDDEDDLPADLLDSISGAFSDPQDLPPAAFSSDSEGHQDAVESGDEGGSHGRAIHVIKSDSEDESETVEGSSRSTSTRRRPGFILDDSHGDLDDEEDGASQPAGGVNRHIRRRAARVLSVDSEDDDENIEDGPRPSRAIPVLDSDGDEDDGDESAQPSRADVRNRARARRQALLEDSDDESGGPKAEEQEAPQEFRFMKRRAPPKTVPTDSDEDPGPSRKATRRARAARPTDADSEDEDSSDEEPPPPKRMSLAKRLHMEYQQSRAARPAADSDEEGTDGYGGASDDEEDEDASEGDGLVMDVAEEGEENEEDEEDDDEGGW